MSFQALAWAANQRTKRSADKLVLLAFADRHNTEQDAAWPSVAWLVDFTSLDRKTVIASMARLVADGYLHDTGERQGRTTQVKVYRLLFDRPADFRPEGQMVHYVYRLTDSDTGRFYIGVRSFEGSPDQDSYRGSGAWPNGMRFNGVTLAREVLAIFADRAVAEQAEAAMIAANRNNPLCMNIAGKSPVFPTGKSPENNSPVFPIESRFSNLSREKRDTEPVREPVIDSYLPPTPTAFDDFWSVYPRKVGKDAARKAWDKRIKQKVDPGRMIEGAKWLAAHLPEGGIKFVPHPATWLNQGRYDDERLDYERAASTPDRGRRRPRDGGAASLLGFT